LITQMTGGVTDPPHPTYLYSGGYGLRDLDKAAINRILARAGVVLKSKATVSERQVVVRLEDGRMAEHTRFWMGTAPQPGVAYPDDEDDGDASGHQHDAPTTAATLALPENTGG
jgi:hypothetical protein